MTDSAQDSDPLAESQSGGPPLDVQSAHESTSVLYDGELGVSAVPTSAKIDEVVRACTKYGQRDLIVLSGVPATGKTHLSYQAALEIAGHPGLIQRTQFHPGYSYEDFLEGFRPRPGGGYEVQDGVFLRWNRQAQADPENTYVLLVEEFSRADIPSVLGELMTFIEHRGLPFVLPISQTPITVAMNLVLLATMNPRDKSALEIDEAMIRRMRILDCPPDVAQLRELLDKSLTLESIPKEQIIGAAAELFEACKREFPEIYDIEMPFGHGVFVNIHTEDDLVALWHQRIRRILFRPQGLTHPMAEFISERYPWR